MTAVTIYVELLAEGVPCWRPVLAEHIGDDIYPITGVCPADESWAFQTGDPVRCCFRPIVFGAADVLVAYDRCWLEGELK